MFIQTTINTLVIEVANINVKCIIMAQIEPNMDKKYWL